VELAKVLALGLSAEHQDWVLGGNLLRLLALRRTQPKASPLVTISRVNGLVEFRDPWSGEMLA
jgi:hypothetical protein